MQTFREFLHSNDWKKPLLPDLTKAMRKVVRSGQVGGTVASTTTIPSHQQLMLVLGQAGARGLSRREITGLVDVDGKVLEDLLSALVRSAEIGVYQRNDGQRVYWLI